MTDSVHTDLPANSLAVVGMVGRFPGARNVGEFWDMLRAGREGVSFFTPDELDPSIPNELRADPKYVRAKGVVADCDKFDAGFFDISPLEAQIMDPQQRLMLEMVWEALESSGYRPSDFPGLIGLYAGTYWNTYARERVQKRPDLCERLGDTNTTIASEFDFATTRVAYKLNLRGPSVSIATACSTSLVAVAQAAQGLLGYDCDVAVAGGISLTVPVNAGYLYQEGGMLSADGHCRTFDANSTGTTFNDGAAFVVLRRLEDAIEDGDNIYAVLRGFGINNDGSDKVSFSAPSVHGQASVIQSALDFADIDPATIGYVEAHGTATPLGDPIEIAALKRAFEAASRGNDIDCALGSAKANVGHLIHAAGVAGMIKAVLAVYHGEIPPATNFETLNPKLELEGSGFHVPTTLKEWASKEHPRRAGVSSFGVGGTNAHVIVEQPPSVPEDVESGVLQALCVSAKDKEALTRQIAAMRDWFEAPPADATLDSVAHTLWAGREHMPWRAAWVADTLATAKEVVGEKVRCIRGRPLESPAAVFMFTGQGAQRVGMGDALRRANGEFRDWFDRGIAILREHCSLDLETVLYGSDADESVIEQTQNAQPALFLYEFSLAKALMAAGLTPDYLVGHSIGELAAATLAGVWSFEDGLKLAASRGAAMQAMPPGSMVALYCSEEEARSYLSDGLAIAGLNAQELTVMSGEHAAVDALCEALEKDDVQFKRLRVSHAFHSDMMQPAVEAMRKVYAEVEMRAPAIPILSTVTGAVMTDAQAVDPDFWANQLLQPVRFAPAIDALLESGNKYLVEVGPGTALTTLAGQSGGRDGLVSRSASPGAGMSDSSAHELVEAVAGAWAVGVDVDLSLPRHGMTPRKKLALPTYAFARESHWIELPEEGAPANATVTPITAPSNLSVVQSQVAEQPPISHPTEQPAMSDSDKISILSRRIAQIFEETSGYDLEGADYDAVLIELGFDSLLLTQASSVLSKEFSVDITFRELMEEYTSIGEIADYLIDKVDLGDEQPAAAAVPAAAAAAPQVAMAQPTMPGLPTGGAIPSDVQTLIDRQLVLMQQQLQVLAGAGLPAQAAEAAAAPATPAAPAAPAAQPATADTAAKETAGEKKRTPATRIDRNSAASSELTRAQKEFIDNLIADYVKKTGKSKEYVAKYRKCMADPRTVSGFSPLLKEMVYPIVTDRSKGSRVWDIDGNEYVDLTNGFGPIFFGHSPDFINEAVIRQIEEGVETGPQSPLAGEVAELFCELTGNERVAFASTGSEAVAGAIRLARAVTGRDKIVIFENSYHGIFDQVIVRPGKGGAGLPAATGIPRALTENMIVLPYGSDEALARIKEMSGDLAAVMVEPVQSRNPDNRPQEFLKEVRKVTEETGTALIFDEVVTGFRIEPGGAQAYYDIRADIATYGKVAGGGHPIGLIGGKARFLDALDGGQWQFGDDSIPEVGVTFFAGTFVRHPLALAATKAALTALKDGGPDLQKSVADKTAAMVADLKSFLDNVGCPFKIEHFTSYCYPQAPTSDPHAGLLWYMLRLNGIHTWEFRPWFMNLSHSDEDIALFVDAFKQSATDLIRIGLMSGDVVAAERSSKAEDDEKPPVDGARLGKDEAGMPAWFAPDPDRPGKYIQVGKRRAS